MFNNKRWVLLVGGKTELVLKAKSLGLAVLRLQDRKAIDHDRLELADYTLTADFDDTKSLIPLVRGLHAVIPFEQVISLSEDTLVLASQIREALHLPGTSVQTSLLFKDKSAMRKHLTLAGISPVVAEKGTCLEDVITFRSRLGDAPVIVKPLDAAGSLGVFKVVSKEECEKVISHFQMMGWLPFLMEEYLDGPEISVEAFSFSGQHHIICFTDKLITSNFIERGHALPLHLDESQHIQVEKLVQEFLSIMGLKDGPSHTEIKLTSRGPRIIESHNRVGGDHINELIETAFGCDVKRLCIAWAFGLAEPSLKLSAQCGAAIRFLIPPPGLIKAIRGIEDIAAAKNVVLKEINITPGEVITSACESGDRRGFILVKGEDSGKAAQYADTLINSVILDLQSGENAHGA